jgi:hypothetical protein
MAPGPGSKDAGNSSIAGAAASNQSGGLVPVGVMGLLPHPVLHAKVFSGMNGTLSLMM